MALQILFWTLTFQLGAGLRRRRHTRLLRRSGLFDVGFYLAQLPDDAAARRDPIGHYLRKGAAAGIDPSPLFDTSYYIEQHPELVASGENPLVHFVSQRAREEPLGRLAGRGSPRLVAQRDYSVSIGRILEDDPLSRPCAPPSPQTSRVLVVDDRILTPDQDSGSVRMFAILGLLRAGGHEVTFVADSLERSAPHEAAIRALGIPVHQGHLAALGHLAEQGRTYRFALLSRPEIVHRYLPAVRAYAPYATVIYDTVDLHWIRLQRAAVVKEDPAMRARAEEIGRIERAAAACADVVLAITQVERDALLAAVPGARVTVLPNVHRCKPLARPWDRREGLMFIGGFEHEPNVDAVRWFVSEVLPLVHRSLPGVVLHVVGSKTPDELRRLASTTVDIAGHVADPEPFFERSRVFVAPIRYGAGMNGKLGHAMSHGLPVVTTSVGAEGMELVDGENALVADGAEAFAAAVVRLHGDELLWARLARNAVRHVADHFSPEAIAPRLHAILSAATTPEEAQTGGAHGRSS